MGQGIREIQTEAVVQQGGVEKQFTVEELELSPVQEQSRRIRAIQIIMAEGFTREQAEKIEARVRRYISPLLHVGPHLLDGSTLVSMTCNCEDCIRDRSA